MSRAVGVHLGWADNLEDTPDVNLFIAVIRQAQIDLTLPTKHKGSNSCALPTPEEQAEARDFLAELTRSASHYAQSEVGIKRRYRR